MNQPAFPAMHFDLADNEHGLTMRDYFAAMALSSPVCLELSLINNWDNERRSEWAYIQADEMLKARGA